MSWIKDVILDVIVTALIVILVFTGQEAAYWAIAIYTPFLLLLKVLFVFGGSLMRQLGAKNDVPEAFYHISYALNTVLLAVGTYWLLAVGWAAIWVLSARAAR